MDTYKALEKFKKIAAKAAEEAKVEEGDFHRFTGFMKEPVLIKKKRKKKAETDTNPIDTATVEKCVDTICQSLVCNLGLGHLTNDISTLGLKFILPIDDDTQVLIESLGMTYRHAVSAGVKKFFDSAEKKSLLDDRISSLLPPSHSKRFGCEKVQIVFDPIVMDGGSETTYAEIFACPYLIGE